MRRKEQLNSDSPPRALQVDERKCPHCGCASGDEKPPTPQNDNFVGAPYISVNQACERWSRCRTTIYKWLNRNHLVAHKDGKSTLINAAVGDAFVASLPRYVAKSGVAR